MKGSAVSKTIWTFLSLLAKVAAILFNIDINASMEDLGLRDMSCMVRTLVQIYHRRRQQPFQAKRSNVGSQPRAHHQTGMPRLKSVTPSLQSQRSWRQQLTVLLEQQGYDSPVGT